MNPSKTLQDWKMKVLLLDMADRQLEVLCVKGTITKRKRNKIKKEIDHCWIKLWDSYPNKSSSIEKTFKLNFS